MVKAGIFAEDERFELIGGEVVPMSPKGRRHEIVRTELAFRMTKLAPAGVKVAAEAQFNLTDDTYVITDVLAYPATIKVPDVKGPSALLVVEIADSSLAYDLDTKAPLYAAHGVRHAWLIDPIRTTLEVYALGARRRWGSPAIHRGAARVHAPPFEAIELDLSALWVPRRAK